MAGIGGIEWGYCGDCCKEVPIIKAAKGAMLEDHYQNGNSGRRTPCVGSLAEPGVAPAEAERVAFSATPAPVEQYDHNEPPTRGYSLAAELPCDCGATEDTFHLPGCAALRQHSEEVQRSRDARSRVEVNREEWARMLAGVTGSVRLAGDGISRMRDALSEASRIDQGTISQCAAAGPTVEETFPRRDTSEFRRGISADLVVMDEINDEGPEDGVPSSCTWEQTMNAVYAPVGAPEDGVCDCLPRSDRHQWECEAIDSGRVAQWLSRATPTHYVAMVIDEEFTLSDEDARRVVEAIASAQGTNRESFGLRTTTAEREPSTIGQIIARHTEGMPEPYLWSGPARVEINGVELPGVTSIEMEGG